MRSRVVVFLLAAVACSSRPTTPVPMVGAPADLSALAGEWDGTYEADHGPRQGSIDFHLRAGSDTALGDVLMIPRGWDRPVEPWERTGAAPRDARVPRPLTIRFVRVTGGEISGELDRYRDPECGCLLKTIFRGSLRGDTLSGRYESRHEGGEPPATGRWRAVRRPPG